MCFFLSCVCYVFVRVCLFVLCNHLLGKGLTSWLSFGVSGSGFVAFPLVSWVGCGAWLCLFLIFAPLLTLNTFIIKAKYTNCSNIMFPSKFS